ncbi:hypothetical protein O1611_g3385 [Lasiodiplodia mahajangana]|uniref:Uncharacterized protein n=1 Tax=Lasiodiplodia mahajangana TaxID=1108764 RepID=A0ACC2JS45_9PEZI|nr:hypothetical protein O1611_g3385 [Lasiodiplodia mahajangana]
MEQATQIPTHKVVTTSTPKELPSAELVQLTFLLSVMNEPNDQTLIETILTLSFAAREAVEINVALLKAALKSCQEIARLFAITNLNLLYIVAKLCLGRRRREEWEHSRKSFSGALPSISSYWSRGGRAARTRDMNGPAFDSRTRNTPPRPTQPAPFTPARKSYDPSAPTSTRKVSASFSTDCPLSGNPTTAYSTVTASTTLDHPRPLTSHPISRPSAFPSSQSHGIMGAYTVDKTPRASHTYSNLPMPAKQSKTPSSKPPSAPAHTNARASNGRNAENIPPSDSMASITTNKQSPSKYPTPRPIPKPPSPKKKAKSRPGIPKSLTFNVFSNLTASLSRTSLGQLTSSDSRRTSISSKGVPYTNPQWESSTSSQALVNPAGQTNNPQQIYTAQSSAHTPSAP